VTDPRSVKNQQRTMWDHLADGWRKWEKTIETGMAPINEALFGMANLQQGQWVLDVMTGYGELAVSAAEKVGAGGKVVAIDLSKKMMAVGEERAKKRNLKNVAFHELDAEELGKWAEKSYDAAFGRFAMHTVPDLPVALRGIHHVLSTGGTFAASVWAAPDKVPFLHTAEEALAPFGVPLPDATTAPSPYALSTPGTLEQAMSSAGFRGIRGERLTCVFEIDSADDYAALIRDTTPLGPMLSAQPDEKQAEMWAAVAKAAGSGKVSLLAEVYCVAGKR
jgi:ubiquinone/menaquinone biosynthesis C-methylase UbiE